MNTIELSDVCYQHIKDTFYYGIFGDFKLVVDKKTGCFNATKLCDYGGKQVRDWKRLEKSKKMVEYYQTNWGGNPRPNFYEVKGANKNNIDKQVTGTYVSKEFILEIASWISVEFYDKCNNIILNYFVAEYKNMDSDTLQLKIEEVENAMEQLVLKEVVIKEKNDKIDELREMLIRQEEERKNDQARQEEERKKDREVILRQEKYMRSLGISLEEVKDQNDILIHENKKISRKADNIQRKLGIAVEDRAPLPDDTKKQERFVLIKRNDDEYYPFYTIRAQNDYTKRKIKSEIANFPDLEILLDFKCNPNSKTLYVRIKENLKAKGVTFKGNNINLCESEVTEEELIEEIGVINEQRYEV
jgi:hypothetical protein